MDVNPELVIEDIPEGTKSLALIMDDPDAPMGTWVHWVVWNIPPDVSTIPEDWNAAGCEVGLNSWRKNEYGGPCPPSGTHRYYFKLYALDTVLELPDNSGKEELTQAMRGHILEEAILMGTYQKS